MVKIFEIKVKEFKSNSEGNMKPSLVPRAGIEEPSMWHLPRVAQKTSQVGRNTNLKKSTLKKKLKRKKI